MTLRCQKELLHDSRIKFTLFLLFPAGVAHTRWYIQFAQPCIWWDRGSRSPHQARHFAAKYPEDAWLCRHMTLCLFLREQLCPRRQIPALSVRVAAHRQEMGAKGCLWQPPFCPRGA